MESDKTISLLIQAKSHLSIWSAAFRADDMTTSFTSWKSVSSNSQVHSWPMIICIHHDCLGRKGKCTTFPLLHFQINTCSSLFSCFWFLLFVCSNIQLYVAWSRITTSSLWQVLQFLWNLFCKAAMPARWWGRWSEIWSYDTISLIYFCLKEGYQRI